MKRVKIIGETLNFGDCQTKNFIETLTDSDIKLIPKYPTNANNYITIGSILTNADKKTTVWGTGFIKEADEVRKPRRIKMVRGPLTRKKYLEKGLKCPESYGDPMILAPLVYSITEPITCHGVALLPHYVDRTEAFKYKEKFKARVLNILTGENIHWLFFPFGLCEYLITSSLHGVILGLVFKKKTIFVQFSDKLIGGTFKFDDFFSSLGITYKPQDLEDPDLLEKYIKVPNSKLIELGLNIIKTCPFFEDDRFRLYRKLQWLEYWEK